MRDIQLSDPIPELGNRTWEELEVVTHDDGHLLFKDQIRRRATKGGVTAVDVRVQLVRVEEVARARTECRLWFKELGLDPDRDKDIFDSLEQVCILSRAIRDPKAPYAQLYTRDELAKQFDEASLLDVLGRIETLRQMLDVRESQLSPEEVWMKVQAVAERGHLGPLTDIAGFEQPSLIVFMARQAMQSPTALSWLRSHGTSTPVPCPETNSAQSFMDLSSGQT